MEPKESQNELKLLQNQAMGCSKFWFVYVVFFRQNNKTGHGRLPHFLKKIRNNCFWHLQVLPAEKVQVGGIGCIPRSDFDVTLVGLTTVKGTSTNELTGVAT